MWIVVVVGTIFFSFALACGPDDDGPSTGLSPTTAPSNLLATYPDDYFSGSRGCAGVVIESLRITISASGQSTGATVPPNASRPGWQLVWPSRFFFRAGSSGPEIADSRGQVIHNGDVLTNVGVCVGDGQLLYIRELSEAASP